MAPHVGTRHGESRQVALGHCGMIPVLEQAHHEVLVADVAELAVEKESVVEDASPEEHRTAQHIQV